MIFLNWKKKNDLKKDISEEISTIKRSKVEGGAGPIDTSSLKFIKTLRLSSYEGGGYENVNNPMMGSFAQDLTDIIVLDTGNTTLK